MLSRSRIPAASAKRTVPPIVIIGWALFCLLVGISLIRSGLGVKEAFTAKDKAQQALREEEKKNQELQQQLKDVQDPLTQEKMIRDQLNMQKPGESVLLLPSPTP